jgi:hypothetical protein
MVVSIVVAASCSPEKKHADYERIEGKWKEVKSTQDGKTEPKHDTWYDFDEDLSFESYTGKGYTYKLDTARHIIKAFGTAVPESGVNTKQFEVAMFEKDYRFKSDTLVLGMVSKTSGKRVETYYVKSEK